MQRPGEPVPAPEAPKLGLYQHNHVVPPCILALLPSRPMRTFISAAAALFPFKDIFLLRDYIYSISSDA